MTLNFSQLNQELGNIDIYLLDQILKARFGEDAIVLDAGCGEGRNMVYFVKNNISIYGVDQLPQAVQLTQMYLKSINPMFDVTRVIEAELTSIPFENEFFTHVVSSAVLHFSQGRDHFRAQIQEFERVLKKGGLLFIRGMVKKGIEGIKDVGNQLFELPDGSVRYLLDESDIQFIEDIGFDWIEEPKWVNVNEERTMSVFVLVKN